MDYEKALLKMSMAMDAGSIDFWDATIALAVLFNKEKEQTADDLVAMRNKPGVMPLPRP